MNWTRPIEDIVELIIVVWLFDILFRPRRNRKTEEGN